MTNRPTPPVCDARVIVPLRPSQAFLEKFMGHGLNCSRPERPGSLLSIAQRKWEGLIAEFKRSAPLPPPQVNPRRLFAENEPEGYLESDLDWLDNNKEATLWFLENAALLSHFPIADRLAQCEASLSIYDAGHDSEYWLRNPSEEATEEGQSSLERFLPTLESMEIRNVTGRDPESVKAGFDLARRSAVDAAKAFISADRAITRAPGAVT